ncbi:MAG: DNA repair protein RadA [Ignavibacteria bacterium]|nr:DNA repair protein RadA [Ignavibacteria bacterium]
MSKTRIKYVCSNCGYESLKWLGKCPECDDWNTFTEEIIETSKRRITTAKTKVSVAKLDEISADKKERIKTGIAEFDRVLGGGLIPGSVILLVGDPGIGKSTLAMQAAAKVSEKVLYVTGEESDAQIKLRASRLKLVPDDFFVFPETDLGHIIAAINNVSPAVVVIDSIQTIYRPELENSPGTITQIRECTSLLMEEAKRKHFSVIIIGHVTKEGMVAGPKILEHIVDTVIQFEGDSHHSLRILRAQKNRFGSTNEIGIFDMREDGLHEVLNPSELFLNGSERKTPGSAVTSSIEGTRPILLEVQALVTTSNYGYPQRVTTGFDQRRLSILLAVLEKRAKIKVSANNIFVNMAGGVRISEPAVDLAVCCSIASSFFDKAINNKTVVVGEVGLGGEIRTVNNIEKRIQEAERLGFKRVVVPAGNSSGTSSTSKIEITSVENLTDAIKILLG